MHARSASGMLTQAVYERKHQQGSTKGGGMANEEHLAMLKQGVEAWNQWGQAYRKEHVASDEHAGVVQTGLFA